MSRTRLTGLLLGLLPACSGPAQPPVVAEREPEPIPEVGSASGVEPDAPERHRCQKIDLVPPAEGEWCVFGRPPHHIVEVSLGERSFVVESTRIPNVDPDGRFVWIVKDPDYELPEQERVTTRLILDVAGGTMVEMRDDPGGRCEIYDGVWSSGNFIGWTWPEPEDDDPDPYSPTRVDLCVVDSHGEVVHVLEQQRLCWGTADAHYALTQFALSRDGEVLVVFHGGCSRSGTLGWMMRMSDGAYRRISATHPRLPSHQEIADESGLLGHQDQVFTLDTPGADFNSPDARVFGLDRSFELEFGPIRVGPKGEQPADGLSVIR